MAGNCQTYGSVNSGAKNFINAIFPKANTIQPAAEAPPVNDPCVQNFLRDRYGPFWGKVADIGNLQQFYPSNNPEIKATAIETTKVVSEKVIATKSPIAIGLRVVDSSGMVWGRSLATGVSLYGTGVVLSAAAELTGAVMTPFGTMAMALARNECTCKK